MRPVDRWREGAVPLFEGFLDALVADDSLHSIMVEKVILTGLALLCTVFLVSALDIIIEARHGIVIYFN